MWRAAGFHPSGFAIGMILWASVGPGSWVHSQTPATGELKTVAEASRYESTSTSAEVEEFLAECDRRSEYIRCVEYGRTVEGRPMTAVVIGRGDPSLAQRDDRLRGLIIGNIHSGECDGKEALLEILRDFAAHPRADWLDQLVLVIAPNYNADGNDRMDKTNRPGQLGPANGMGVRANAQQFDLNRDFMKLEAPESRHLVRLMDEFDPHYFIDCHTTNGSRHRYLLTYDVPHNPAAPELIRRLMREQLLPEITAKLKEQQLETFYYGNFDRTGQRWETYGFEPRYSIEYAGLRGMLGFLSESYSYASYEERIRASREFVLACIAKCLEREDQVRRVVAQSRAEFVEAVARRPESIHLPLDCRMIAFEPREKILAYRDDAPAEVEVEFWGDYEPLIAAAVPEGYVFPADKLAWRDKLIAHGIEVTTLDAPRQATVELEKILKMQKAPRPFQTHHMVRLETESRREVREIPAGWFLVRSSQPLGRLAVYLCEARSCDGLATWNFLDDDLETEGDFPIWRLIESGK